MTATAYHTPVPWAEIPAAQVVRLAGVTAEELAVALDPPPDGVPVGIWYRPPAVGAAAMIVEDALAYLESVARQLFPVWLPRADRLGTSDLDRRAVRVLARGRAAVSDHYGPFLADLADAALTGRDVRGGHSPDVRAHGLFRVLADAYRTGRITLLIAAADTGDEDSCGIALRWLAAYGGFGVWLLGDVLCSVDRFPTVNLPPAHPAGAPTGAAGRVAFPPLAGRPHPASPAEQALERALAPCAWARGRSWNQVHQPHPLARPIRVDLMWPDARCVVEVDGPDHRGAVKYADDRRRDNSLVMAGFTVLRFTNEDIADDLSRVVGMIEELVSAKRPEGENA